VGRVRTIRILACVLLLASNLCAQRYVFHPYRQADGLQNLSVKAMAVDRAGFLWVGTENGVYRFLGSGFEKYAVEQGIAERDIQDVFADLHGGIWVGTYENLYRWDGQRFAPAGKDPIHIWGSKRMAAEDVRHLLVVDKNRLYRLGLDAQGKMQSYAPVFSQALMGSIPIIGHLSSVTVVSGSSLGRSGDRPADRSGRVQVWMGCGKLLCSWSDPRSNSLETRKDSVTEWGADEGVSKDIWSTVLIDRQGTLWAVGQHHVITLAPGARRFVDRNFPDDDPTSVYRQSGVAQDKAGRILVATEEGVARWEDSHWRTIGPETSLRTSHITDMAFDAAGDLWLGSIGHGLIDWVGYGNWEGWTDQNGLPSASIWSVKQFDADDVMTGTEKGPAWVDLASGSAHPILAGKQWKFGQVSTIGRDPDGSIWAGTFSGAILRIDAGKDKAGKDELGFGTVERTAQLPSLIYAALQDRQGRLLFLTAGGVYSREANAPRSTPRLVPEVDKLLGESTHADVGAGCVESDGSAWVLANNRMLRERDGAWTMPPIDGFSQFPKGAALVAVSCAADGTFWVTGQQAGTWRLTWNNPHTRLSAWRLQLPSEMAAYSSLAILVDRRGWVWQGTDAGLLVWNGREWRHLTQESGLIWNDINQGVLYESGDGTIFAGSSGGLARLLHPERVFEQIPVGVSITDVRRGDKVYPITDGVTLPWASQPLSLRISSSAMRNRSELEFMYRMEGLQQDWVRAPGGVAVFSALPPGSYTFRGVARNSSMDALSPAVSMKVVVLPPWWRSGWMFAVYGVLLLLLVIFADWLRARNLRRISRQLQRLVSARTSELEQSREQLRIQATYDSLTGLLNRAAILRVLTTEIERARREGKNLIVALADLDYFKEVNDTYGHLAGDEALRLFAATMKSAIRPYDHVGRYGGEEFLLVLPDVPEDLDERRLSELHARITNLCVEEASNFVVNCSLGAAILHAPFDLPDPQPILAAADQALYDAKASGRNRVVWRQFGDTEKNPAPAHSKVQEAGSIRSSHRHEI
jgi:diguanylate cyclase (GGDEF)-like protein